MPSWPDATAEAAENDVCRHRTCCTTIVPAKPARPVVLAALLIAAVLEPRGAAGYSVLTHQAIVDGEWNVGVKPLLRQRFPRISEPELTRARAFAYGGSVIQDLGYYPFG